MRPIATRATLTVCRAACSTCSGKHASPASPPRTLLVDTPASDDVKAAKGAAVGEAAAPEGSSAARGVGGGGSSLKGASGRQITCRARGQTGGGTNEGKILIA